MKMKLAALALACIALAGCQTIEEAATAEVVALCTSGGYGPGTQHHDYCVNTLKPVAARMERQRRQKQINEGVQQMSEAFGGRQPRVTCTQTGDTVRCY